MSRYHKSKRTKGRSPMKWEDTLVPCVYTGVEGLEHPGKEDNDRNQWRFL